MKNANGQYVEIVVVINNGSLGLDKRVYWSHAQAMIDVQAMLQASGNPILIESITEREPTRYTQQLYPELYVYE